MVSFRRQLAETLGVKQPRVARLESGEHEPSLATPRMLAERLDIGIVINVSPVSQRTPWLKTRPAGAVVGPATIR